MYVESLSGVREDFAALSTSNKTISCVVCFTSFLTLQSSTEKYIGRQVQVFVVQLAWKDTVVVLKI